MTRTATRTGRHRAPRPRRWVWPTTAALVVAVTASVLGTGGTYALWNGSATTAGATVRSGTATISVSAISAMETRILAPGTGVTGTFTVQNTGTVPLAMRVTSGVRNVAWVPDATKPTVLDEETLHLAVVATPSDCRPGLGGATGRVDTFDTGSGYYTMPPGARGVGCLEIALDADAPQSVAGAVTDFTLTVTGTQVRP
ncbi:TasA family protein [Curtobacterium sp. 9128]|uniref:TasA family protein n=1 Tax=Curtobacterium sp. 9128 TaxID=1793722 RepID=UPI00119D3ABC|nr:TasA family protein [Curtobacterium sp. 9128]